MNPSTNLDFLWHLCLKPLAKSSLSAHASRKRFLPISRHEPQKQDQLLFLTSASPFSLRQMFDHAMRTNISIKWAGSMSGDGKKKCSKESWGNLCTYPAPQWPWQLDSRKYVAVQVCWHLRLHPNSRHLCRCPSRKQWVAFAPRVWETFQTSVPEAYYSTSKHI